MNTPAGNPDVTTLEKRPRSIWYELHFWIGWIAAVPIALVCLTGTILTFEKEITQWEHKSLFQLEVTGLTPTLDQVLAAYNAAGYQVNHLGMPQDPRHAYQAHGVQIRPEGRRNVAVAYDPYTGQFYNKADSSSLVRTTTRIHRVLLSGRTGQTIIAVSSLLLAVTAIVGLILWWPMRGKTMVRAWKRGQAIDWHNALGLAAILPLIVMAITGVTFTWGPQLFPVLEKLQGSPSRLPNPVIAADGNILKIPLQALAERVKQTFPGTPLVGVQPSNAKNRPHVFIMQQASNNVRVFMNPYTGEEITRMDGSGLGPVGWYRNNFGKWHTFGPYGLLPRTMWALFSLLGTILVVTGLWVSTRRWQRRKRAAI